MTRRLWLAFVSTATLVLGLVLVSPPSFAGTVAVRDDSASTRSGQAVTIDVLANDTFDAPPVTLTIDGNSFGGTAVVQPDNTIMYTPHSDFTGQDSFGYDLVDKDGTSGFGQVDVTVDNAVHSAGPLTRVFTSPDLNCAVNHAGDSSGEFYGDTACATFLVVDGTVYSPSSIPAGQPGRGWTPISQSTTGSGTAGDPYRIVTDVAAGNTGVTLTQTDTYVVGSESVTTSDVIHNGSTARTVTLYRAADCYLNDSDTGLAQVDATSGAVACKSPTSNRIEQWLPLSPGSHYYEAAFDEVWSAINAQSAFPDTCRCADNIDNGAGLSWSASLAAGASATRSSLITFSPQGVAPLTLSASAAPGHVGPGGEVTYQVAVGNSGNADATLTSLTDTLPAGFHYVAGSTTGAATSNPDISGNDLTWPLSTTVPAQGSVTLTFHATAATDPGTYQDQATGAATGAAVVGTGETAPVTVDPDTTPPGSVQDLSATPGDQVVDLSWVNPADLDLAQVRVFYEQGAAAPAYGQGTELGLGSATPHSAHVTGLANGTLYSFAVFAVDASDNHSDPSSVSATPKAATVDPVSNLQAASAGPTAVTLTWTNPASLDGIVVRYATTAAPATVADGTGFPVSGTPNHATVTGLTTGTHYYFSVFASSGAKTSPAASTDFTPFDTHLPPHAVDDTATTPSGTAVDTNVLANDTDPAKENLSVSGHTNGSHGTVSCTPTTCTYTPAAGYVGSDSYTYTVSNTDGLSDTGSVSVTVTNRAPHAMDDPATTPSGTAVETSVLANDTDPEGQALSVTDHAAGAQGSVTCTSTKCTYTPNAGFVGSDSYTYTISDGHGGTDVGAVAVTVTNRAPHAVDDTATTPSGTAVETSVLANDTDPEGQALSVTDHTAGAHGSVTCTSTKCTYTPNAGYVGSDSYTYTISDGHGGTDVGAVAVTVTGSSTATDLTIHLSASSLTWPGSVTVSGVLSGSGGPVAGQQVELWVKRAGGSFTKIATVTSGSDGSVSSSDQPQTGSTYEWRTSGPLTSADASVAVAPRVTLAAPTPVPVGTKVKFTGIASPVRAGAAVQLQRKSHGTWHTIKSGTFASGSTSTSSGASYRFKVKLTSTGGQQFRTVVPADSGRTAGASAAVTVTVFSVTIKGVHPKGDEYVTVKNTGPVSVHLAGWKLKTRSGHVTLPAFTLAPGDQLRIHPGHGHSHGKDLYLGGGPMCGDRHDTVKLIDADGRKVARFTY